MIARTVAVRRVLKLLGQFRVVAILGARQVGKSTLAGEVARRSKGPVTLFDLERPHDLAQLRDPELALRPLRGLVVLDEIQRRPDLFPVMRGLVDRPRPGTRFLVLGSASPELLRQSSETLAGRIAHYELGGFDLGEVGCGKLDRLWLRGGFPRSFLARSQGESMTWREEFISTFLERDLPQLGIGVASTTLRRFWTMLAHYHGQTWNASEFGRSFGVADTTVRRYLDLLTSTFVVRQLPAWRENLKKRQVKSPKVYIRDSGLLHALLGIPDRFAMEGHPKVGASWEGFLLSEVVRRLRLRPHERYYWATHTGAELDLFVRQGRRRLGFEFKRTVAPRVTRSMRSALDDLRLSRLDVVHAGDETFPLAARVRAVAASRLIEDLKPRV